MTVESNGKTVGEVATRNSFWHIDREMLGFKIHFFLYIGGLGAAIPYIVVFARERLGLAASSMGAVLTAQMFLFILFKPLVGYIADYFNRLKAIICILTIINGSGYFLLLAIPPKHQPTQLSSTAPFYSGSECSQRLRSLIGLNFTDTATQTEMCDVSVVDFDSFFNVSKLCCLGNETTKYESLDYKETVDRNRKALVLFCKQNCTIDIVLCNDDYKTPHQNYSVVFTECNRKLEVSSLCSISENTNTSHEKRNVPENERTISDFRTLQFWLFAFLFSLSSVTGNATFTLSDTACCESIQKTGASFGRQRLWGAIGWGIMAPLAGFLNDTTHSFLPAWILMAAMLLLFIWNLSKLNLVKPHYSQNILKDVGTVLRDKEFLCFELAIVMNGISLGMVWFYLIWFLTVIGGSDLLCGLCLTVQSFVGSIPFMFFSGWIIEKIGHFQVLILALFTNMIRFLWYSYLRNPWWALPVEWTHGIAYGLYYTALASYGKMSAKPGTEATTQSIIFSTNEGLGCGLGCIFAGLGFDHLGGHETFFITGIFSGCGCLVSIALALLVIGKQKKTVSITPLTNPTASCVSNGI